VVRHVKPGSLGLKFVAISDEDRPHLTALMTEFVISLDRKPNHENAKSARHIIGQC
jgi:hypothetical protein